MGSTAEGVGRVAPFTVRKRDYAGREVIAYPGEVLQRDEHLLVLRTAWVGASRDLGFVVLEPSDLWREFFFPGRWYNVFEIRTGDGRLKGWYCNITRPPEIRDNEVSADDLALDVWVTPERKALVLDEHEFEALPLTRVERKAAREALDELLALAERGAAPFDAGEVLPSQGFPNASTASAMATNETGQTSSGTFSEI